MVARPALAALGCRSCQNAVFRAILRTGAPALRTIPQHYTPPRRLLPVARRVFSTDQKNSPAAPPDASPEEPSDDTQAAEEQPWFLDEEPPRHPPSLHKPKLPTTPEDVPAMLEPMIKYVYEDMGLDNLSMLDLRDLDPHASLGPNLIMLFGTARSERHLHVASGRFVRWLRRNHNVGARAEGLIGPGELKTKLRRLRKKAKLMGQNTAMVPGGDHGISTGWVCVNFRALEDAPSEGSRFDEDGSITGFGASQSGTTVVVQCMTEARREELDLEKLWKDILKRNLDEQARIRGEEPGSSRLHELLESKLQLHQGPGASQWEAMEQASQQRRSFTTSARRLQIPQRQAASASEPDGLEQGQILQAHRNADAEALRQKIVDIQISGAAMDQTQLESLVSAVLLTQPAAGITAADRLALVDQLLLTGSERGLAVRSREMLVTLIEGLVASPAYGPELGRAQKNFELLLAEAESPPSVEEVSRLMEAYAHQQDWDRFWDMFRAPTRFNLPRSSTLYALAYRTIAATKDAALCAEALRWVYPEMLMEKPAVPPQGPVYRALKSCILVADPAAEELLSHPPLASDMTEMERRALQRREFVKVLREVEALRAHTSTQQ